MKKAKFLSIGLNDLAKGLIMAVIGAVIGVITTSIEAGSISFNWRAMGSAALIAALTYLSKNLLTNSKDEFLTKEPK